MTVIIHLEILFKIVFAILLNDSRYVHKNGVPRFDVRQSLVENQNSHVLFLAFRHSPLIVCQFLDVALLKKLLMLEY